MRLRRALPAIVALLVLAGAAPGAGASPAAPLACPGLAYNVVPSANALTLQNNYLTGLAVVSANDMWAVGHSDSSPPGQSQTLSEHWDGVAWTVVPGPVLPDPTSQLTAVAAVSSNDVWAVGFTASNPSVTLVERWDGAAWSVVPSPSVPGASSTLLGVDALSPSDVWAVGASFASASATLAMHWDGAAWTLVPSPTPGLAAALDAVDAIASNDVWAVGWTQFNAGVQQTLVEHWDGTSWTVVPSPNLSLTGNVLHAVRAVSASDVWAAGEHFAMPGPLAFFAPTILHWDGAAWAAVPCPSLSPGQDHFLTSLAVSCANEVHAAGYYDTGSGGDQSLVARWDGSVWCTDAGPMGGVEGNELDAAAAVPGRDVWVAGFSTDLLLSRTLTARAASLALPPGTIGNSLLAAKRGAGADVALDWSAGPLFPRSYNVHREVAKQAIAPPASPPLAAVNGAETYLDPGAIQALPELQLYEVYGADCVGRSIFD